MNHAAIHISKQYKPIISPQAAPSERAQKATPSTKLGEKCLTRMAYLPDPELGGPQVFGAFTPEI